MLPTSRRDAYDNAKRRRGGKLKTLLRKEGRLIQQLIACLLFAGAVFLIVRWVSHDTSAANTAKVEQLGRETNSRSKAKDDRSEELQIKPEEEMPRVSLGGKRFLPLGEESDDVAESDDKAEDERNSGAGLDGALGVLEDGDGSKTRKGKKSARLADLLSEMGRAKKDGNEERVVKDDSEKGAGEELRNAGALRGQTEKSKGQGNNKKEVVSSDETEGDSNGEFDGGEEESAMKGGIVSDTGGVIRTGPEEDWESAEIAAKEAARKGKKAWTEEGDPPPPKVIKSPAGEKGADSHWEEKRRQVAAAFEDSWAAYHKHAWGYDELRPVSRQGEDGLGGLGATIVDALDTAMIMGLGDVVEQAGNWIDRELPKRLETQGYVNLFETTIRVLGGLLSAYHLSGGGGADLTLVGGAQKTQGRGPPSEVYLKRAQDLGERLMSAFSSPTAVPFSDVHLADKEGRAAMFDGGSSSTAEVATLGMEFCYLSKLTGDSRYCESALGVVKHIQKQRSVDGLVPIFINPHSGHFDGNNIRLGSRGDSYYEYLLKVWMQEGGADTSAVSDVRWLREMWDESMAGVRSRLLAESVPSGLLFVGERPDGLRAELSPKMDHLVCFLPGALALGATKGRTLEAALAAADLSDADQEDLRVAIELTRTCYAMYDVTLTGLAPEIAYFNTGGGVHGMPPGNPKSKYLNDIIIQPLDRHNLLRPETVESLFVLYRVTGDEQYREWGWEIFKNLEAHAKVATGGYSSLHDVTKIPAPSRDKMETFFLGETLKYLYLLFSDLDVLPLDRFVFNTEAHPLPVWAPSVEEDHKRSNSKSKGAVET